jgi:PAS domain S-box-containing protein
MPEQSEFMNDMIHLAFDACPAAMFMATPDGTIALVNTQCETMFGFERGQMIGIGLETLVPDQIRARHQALRAGFAAQPSKRLMGVGRDLRALRRDGSEFPVEIGLTPIDTPLGPRVLAFVIDISARLNSEKAIRGYMAELERANQSLSRFAYVASHDIQEPLRKIAAFANVLSEAIGRDDKEESLYAASVMTASAQQARRLVADLLTLARSHNNEYELERVSIGSVIDETLENLSQTILDEAAQISRFGDNFEVRGDKSQLQQLVQNILSNALKYHHAARPPVVRIKLRKTERNHFSLAVEDEGIGFSPANADVIFEPFRRLHPRDAFPGSGIGLAICKTIASRHGWRLTATSAPAAGATFEIIFPKDSLPGDDPAST